MSASLFELLKYAQTGIASPGMTFYDKMRASVLMGGGRAETLTGIPPLTLNKSAGKPLKSWSITGNIAQDGTPTPEQPVDVKMVGDRTGNLLLFPYDRMEQSSNGGHFVCDENQVIHADGTPTTVSYISLVNNKKISEIGLSAGEELYLSWITTNDNLVAQISAKNASGETVLNKQNIGAFVMPTDAETVTVVVKRRVDNISIDGEIKVMLNAGTEPLPYEPYGYRIPVVARGKNLCPPLVAGLGLNSASGVELSNRYGFLSDYIPVDFDINPKYVLSNINYALHSFVAAYNENKEFVGRGSGNNVYMLTMNNKYFGGGTPTATGKIKFLRVYQYALTGERTDDFINKLMLVAGDTEQPYEPYIPPTTTPIYLPTPLASGEVLRSDGSRDVSFTKHIFDGSEDWYERGDGFSYREIKAYGNAFTTHFFKCASLATLLDGGVYYGSTSAVYRKDDCETIESFKAWLKSEYDKGTPVITYYQLITPTTETVTIPPIPTLKGTTILDVDTEVKPTEMTVEYLV